MAHQAQRGWHRPCVSECRFREEHMSVERIISVGLVGWLVVGILLMGLDIW